MSDMSNTRLFILQKAAAIFYQHGYRATGIDFIAKSAGVTKSTLYHHFVNKDDLIAETLQFLSQFHRNNYQAVWARHDASPIDKLTALFDAMEIFFAERDCYGCPFINAAAEYSDRDSVPRKICHDHYAFLTDNLEVFAQEAQLLAPRELAEQLAMIIAGTYSAWVVAGYSQAARQGKKMAEMIIRQHTFMAS